MALLSVAGGAAHVAVRLTADAASGGLTINLFWIIVSALNFVIFFALFMAFGSGPLTKMLSDRRERIAQGLADAEQARHDREASVAERQTTLQEARREAKEIIDRAQKVAQETRDADIAATREELERLRVRAAAEIESEKERVMQDLRGEVANLALAAAGQVVGETMSDARQRRLVDEFLAKAGNDRVRRLMARPSTAARRYAESAFEIATRDSTIDRWRSDLDGAATVLEDPAVARGLSDPTVPAELREQAISSGFGSKVSGPVLNLLKLLVQRGRIEDLPRIAEEFRRLDNQRLGIAPARVVSAAPLEPAEVKALIARLEQMTGGQIELAQEVDPSLLGGLVVRVGDRLIDGSVRGRLERLRNQLVSGAL